MYICYLDESGNVERRGTTPYFVLLGLAIPASSWKAKDREIQTVLNRHNLYGEIHTAWMVRRYPEQERVSGFPGLAPDDRRAVTLRERKADLAKAAMRGTKAVKALAKNYRKTEPFIHLTHAERVEAVRAVADTIRGWNDATLFADAQRKAAHDPNAQDQRILDFAFEQVVTRYHHLLVRQGIEVGIIVQDQNDTAALRLTRLARRYHRGGTAYSTIDRIVETPLFVDSELTLLVQMADLCSYAVRRFFENSETDLFDRIYPRFDRLGTKLVGLRHYTGSAQCTCRVCVDHGR